MKSHFGNQQPTQQPVQNTGQYTGQYMVPTVKPQAPEVLKKYVSQFQDGLVKTEVGDLYMGKKSFTPQESFDAHALANIKLAQYVQGLYDVINVLVANMQPYENPNDIL